MSFTTPFRGTVTVLEVTTPNLVVSKRVSLSAALCSSGSQRIFFFILMPRRSQGFTDKGISVHQGLFSSLNGTGEEGSWHWQTPVFVYLSHQSCKINLDRSGSTVCFQVSFCSSSLSAQCLLSCCCFLIIFVSKKWSKGFMFKFVYTRLRVALDVKRMCK